MEVEIMCGDEKVNEWDGKDFENPFPDGILPAPGDYIELGEGDIPIFEGRKMQRYKVIDRSFSAVMTYNREYTGHKCVINVVKDGNEEDEEDNADNEED